MENLSYPNHRPLNFRGGRFLSWVDYDPGALQGLSQNSFNRLVQGETVSENERSESEPNLSVDFDGRGKLPGAHGTYKSRGDDEGASVSRVGDMTCTGLIPSSINSL